MKIGQILSLAGATIMGFSIIYGLIVGDFAGEGSVIFSLLWGKVTLIDIFFKLSDLVHSYDGIGKFYFLSVFIPCL